MNCKLFDENNEPVPDEHLNMGNCGMLSASLEEIMKYNWLMMINNVIVEYMSKKYKLLLAYHSWIHFFLLLNPRFKTTFPPTVPVLLRDSFTLVATNGFGYFWAYDLNKFTVVPTKSSAFITFF